MESGLRLHSSAVDTGIMMNKDNKTLDINKDSLNPKPGNAMPESDEKVLRDGIPDVTKTGTEMSFGYNNIHGNKADFSLSASSAYLSANESESRHALASSQFPAQNPNNLGDSADNPSNSDNPRFFNPSIKPLDMNSEETRLSLNVLHGKSISESVSNQDSMDNYDDNGERQEIEYVKTLRLFPNPNQPRKVFDKEKLEELAESISRFGILQPIVAQKSGVFYYIIAGERRWRAAHIAGLETVPVIVRDMDDWEAAEVALVENIQREDLSPIEEAMAYRELMNKFGFTQEEIAKKVSKSRPVIGNSLRLLDLEPEILEMLNNKEISVGHARALLGVEPGEARMKAAEDCRKGAPVRSIEALAKKRMSSGTAHRKKNTDDTSYGDHEKNNRAERAIAQEKAVFDKAEDNLRSKLGLKVKINGKDGKGNITIDFYSMDDLDRIYDQLMKIN